MNRALLSVLLLIISILPTAASEADVDSVLRVLDSEIAGQSTYEHAKEHRLDALRADYQRERNAEDRFRLATELYKEYRYYQNDSAWNYAQAMADIAATTGNPHDISAGQLYMMDCYTTAGYFKEATEVGNPIVLSNLNQEERLEYYKINTRLYQQMESYAGSNPLLRERYKNKRIEYYRMLADSCAAGSYAQADARLSLEMDTAYNPAYGLERRRELMRDYDIDDHEKAVNYSVMGQYAKQLGNADLSATYFALSAIHDIRSSTHETTAAKDLASEMHSRGELQRANLYIHQALSDANFFNSRIRSAEINSILPLIENDRYTGIYSQRTWLAIFAVILVLMLTEISVLFYKLKRRSRSLSESNLEIVRQSRELEITNENLQRTNQELKEATEIKDQYIIQSLIGNTDFVNSVEQKCKKAISKLKAKQYTELNFLLYEMGVKRERERMYSSFDSAFLKLFPNFIEEFNRLFPEEHHINVDSNGELPTEVRIFALMRLGLDNPTEVANYLNLSVNTVYVYKTKVKSKSTLGKTEFDEAIMKIPKP